MPKYIEREALLDSIGSVPPWWGYFEPYTFEQWQGINTTHEAIKKIIKEQPTADVQQVRHGKWLKCFEDYRKQILGDKCSVCGFEHYSVLIHNYQYCPNCGAKMDKERENK